MTIRDFFDEAVSSCGQRVFLRWHDGERWVAMTYAEAEAAVIRTCAALKRLGLTKAREGGYPMRVAIMRENCPEWIIAYLAVAGTGLIVVPVDPHLRPPEARHIIEDSGAALVIADDRLAELLGAAGLKAKVAYAGEIAEAVAALSPGELAEGEAWWRENRPQTDDLASIVYTSGTTGAPKGAMLTHGNFTANVDQTFTRVMFYPTDHFLLALPLFHVFAFTLNFLVPLRKTAEISFARTMRSIPVDMAELRPTVLMAVPLLAELLYARARDIVCKLRVLGLGGAPSSKATLEALVAAGVYVLEGYGITECAPGVAYPDQSKYVVGTVGTPLDGIDWRIVNSDETGAGELRVKGPNVMKGYWNNPAETERAFDSDGFYRTGDIVRPGKDGNLQICGRIKALIVNREGKNIYPEEIERAIRRCPLVAEALVVGYRMSGEVGEHVGAIVVPNPEAVKSAHPELTDPGEIARLVRREVQALCHDLLTEYKLPRKVEVRFVPLEHTSSMKVKRFLYARALDE